MAELKARQSTSQQEAESLRRQVRAAEAAKAELSEFEVEFNTGSCKNESTIIEVEQGCPIPGDRDVKTSHRKKEERGAI